VSTQVASLLQGVAVLIGFAVFSALGVLIGLHPHASRLFLAPLGSADHVAVVDARVFRLVTREASRALIVAGAFIGWGSILIERKIPIHQRRIDVPPNHLRFFEEQKVCFSAKAIVATEHPQIQVSRLVHLG